VLVTGATRGIGLGIAHRLAAEGATVAIVGRDAAAGAAAVSSIQDQGGAAHFVGADLQQLDGIPGVVDQVRSALGGIDVICHAAGIYPEHALSDMTVTRWNAVMDTNLTAAMLLLRETLPDLTAARHGRVVMISSITGPRTGIESLSHYAASKGGLEGFVRAAAVELAPSGITVNAVAPGTILTESLQELYDDPGVMSDVVGRIPVGRIGKPDDIAATVSFLAGPDTDFITGQSIVVDGGQTLPEVQ
jgi:3-oxoacyl-[acyl-carrier protein] reductase